MGRNESLAKDRQEASHRILSISQAQLFEDDHHVTGLKVITFFYP